MEGSSIWSDSVALSVWSAVASGPSYAWPIGAVARARLAALMPGTRLPADLAAANLALRAMMPNAFAQADTAGRCALATWIVADWGGVRGNGTGRLAGYVARMGDFSLEALSAFADSEPIEGVSSWSKLLSMAAPETFAIYDARTAVALNIALARTGDDRRFHMPSSKNKRIMRVMPLLRVGRRTALGYGDCLAALGALARAARSAAMLDVEMRLFASAPSMAEAYLAEHDAERC